MVKTCNTGTTVDHCKSKTVESLCSTLTISGNKMQLGKFHEHFQEQMKMTEPLDVNPGTPDSETMLMSKANNCFTDDQISELDGEVSRDPDCTACVKSLDHHVNISVHTLICTQQFGEKFVELRQELQHNFMWGANCCLTAVDEANFLSESHEGSE